MAALPTRYWLNNGSPTITSGSGYIAGGAWRPHSRGGDVVVLGGMPDACCAPAVRANASGAEPSANKLDDRATRCRFHGRILLDFYFGTGASCRSKPAVFRSLHN